MDKIINLYFETVQENSVSKMTKFVDKHSFYGLMKAKRLNKLHQNGLMGIHIAILGNWREMIEYLLPHEQTMVTYAEFEINGTQLQMHSSIFHLVFALKNIQLINMIMVKTKYEFLEERLIYKLKDSLNQLPVNLFLQQLNKQLFRYLDFQFIVNQIFYIQKRDETINFIHIIIFNKNEEVLEYLMANFDDLSNDLKFLIYSSLQKSFLQRSLITTNQKQKLIFKLNNASTSQQFIQNQMNMEKKTQFYKNMNYKEKKSLNDEYFIEYLLDVNEILAIHPKINQLIDQLYDLSEQFVIRFMKEKIKQADVSLTHEDSNFEVENYSEQIQKMERNRKVIDILFE